MSDIDLTEAQQTGYQSVEDMLIELRDERIGVLGYANGVVVNERDGSPSSVVRMTTRWATDQAITAALPHIERQVREQVAREIEEEAQRRRSENDEMAAAMSGVRPKVGDGVRFGLDLAARIARGES